MSGAIRPHITNRRLFPSPAVFEGLVFIGHTADGANAYDFDFGTSPSVLDFGPGRYVGDGGQDGMNRPGFVGGLNS